MPFNKLVTSIIDRGRTLDNLRQEIIFENVCLFFCDKRQDEGWCAAVVSDHNVSVGGAVDCTITFWASSKIGKIWSLHVLTVDSRHQSCCHQDLDPMWEAQSLFGHCACLEAHRSFLKGACIIFWDHVYQQIWRHGSKAENLTKRVLHSKPWCFGHSPSEQAVENCVLAVAMRLDLVREHRSRAVDASTHIRRCD
jgi:hypothetical protein